jgi:hypothetical protein
VFYVDTINKDSFITEMYGYCIRYIRERIAADSKVEHKKYLARDENDIYYNKLDGHWLISDEKNKVVTLYVKTTWHGWVHNSVTVKKIFMLTCKECPKLVPRIPKKKSMFEDFTQELTEKVLIYRDRNNLQ